MDQVPKGDKEDSREVIFPKAFLLALLCEDTQKLLLREETYSLELGSLTLLVLLSLPIVEVAYNHPRLHL